MTATGATVLVVEDDKEMRLFLEEELREAGYEVLTAARGAEALHHLDAESPDVVLTDHMMPGMKGSELLAEIRDRDLGIPVVIITAFGTIESAVEAVKAGAYHYVAKPFQTEQLLLTVANALRERRLRQELRHLRKGSGRAGAEDCRGEPWDAKGRGPGCQGGGCRYACSAPGRKRHRQRTLRPRATRGEPAPQRPVRRRQLLRHPRHSLGEPPVRPPPRGFHRC